MLLILRSCGTFSHLIYYVPQLEGLLSLIFLPSIESPLSARSIATDIYEQLYAQLSKFKNQNPKIEAEFERKMANFMAQYRALVGRGEGGGTLCRSIVCAVTARCSEINSGQRDSNKNMKTVGNLTSFFMNFVSPSPPPPRFGILMGVNRAARLKQIEKNRRTAKKKLFKMQSESHRCQGTRQHNKSNSNYNNNNNKMTTATTTANGNNGR